MKQGFKIKYVQFVPEFHTALLTKSRPNVKCNKEYCLPVMHRIEYEERLNVRS